MVVKINKKEVEELQKAIQGALNDSDEILSLCVDEIALRLYKLIQRPSIHPVDTGWLRENWELGAIKKWGNSYTVEITNPVNYAPYVEYGHRIVKDGVTVGWRDGAFMLTISEMEIEKQKNRIIQRRIEKWLKDKIK